MPDTSTPAGAREHARAQAASQAASVKSRPRLPLSEARRVPEDLDASALLWDETLAAGAYASRILERGDRLRLIDVEGDACAHFIAIHADQTAERLNVADTIKVQWQAYLGAGSLLLSDMGRVLLSMLRDDSGQHDTFCGASNQASNQRRFGAGENHGPYPNARDRFALALGKHGLTRRDIPPSLTFFKGVRVEKDGSLLFQGSAGDAGNVLELRAEMRCLVVICNAPHVLDPRTDYQAGLLRLLAWPGPFTNTEDEIRNSTPERQRAFENVDDYYAGGPHD